jgi:hypothetical protein
MYQGCLLAICSSAKKVPLRSLHWITGKMFTCNKGCYAYLVECYNWFSYLFWSVTSEIKDLQNNIDVAHICDYIRKSSNPAPTYKNGDLWRWSLKGKAILKCMNDSRRDSNLWRKIRSQGSQEGHSLQINCLSRRTNNCSTGEIYIQILCSKWGMTHLPW